MSRTMVRTVAAVLVLSALSLPAAAQPEPRKASPLTVLAQLWDRIAAPVLSLFTAADPNKPTGEGRGGWDPDGLIGDGRSEWDPNS